MTTKERVRYLLSMRYWLAPGMGVKRHVALAVAGALLLVLGVIGAMLWLFSGNRQALSQPIEGVLVSGLWLSYGLIASLVLLAAGLTVAIVAVGRLNRSLLSNWMPRPYEAAALLHQRLQLSRGPRIVAFGGGTGLSNLLRGLRAHSSNLTAVVTVADDGGSSGRLRLDFGMPAPGDLSDCLAALSDNELEVSRLLQYRFQRGRELIGHTFGNLLITTLTEVEGDFGRAVRALNSLLNLSGSVYPATTVPVSLCVRKSGGQVVRGESAVRETPGAVESVSIEPETASSLPEVIDDIARADLIVLGPGSLFTSTIPPLLVPAVRGALLETRAPLLYVCNIMTEAGETDGFTAFDHVVKLREHLGRAPDWVVVNSAAVDQERLAAYEMEGAEVVSVEQERFSAEGIRLARLDLLGSGPYAQHDADALAEWLIAFCKRGQALKAGVHV
ncbi:MAG TPA: uridine diphosphate-N-acetylglucosamine-binding protein YvcK [Trueperaceae bacterium]